MNNSLWVRKFNSLGGSEIIRHVVCSWFWFSGVMLGRVGYHQVRVRHIRVRHTYVRFCYSETYLVYMPMAIGVSWKITYGVHAEVGRKIYTTTYISVASTMMTLHCLN